MFVFLMSRCKLIEIDNNNLQDRFGSLTVYLARYYNLPLDHQILLTNGGCQLKELHEIDDHSAGEDPTNPVYVFSRDNTITPEKCVLKAHEIPQNLLDALKTPTESTVLSFQKYLKGLIAAVKEDGETIQRLDQEQRLMCEGWFVAQANFDHDMREFRKALDVYWKDYANFCGQVGRWETNMSKFPGIKNRLRSVPLLPSLLTSSTELMSESNSVYGPPRNLYDWVCLQMASITPRRLGAPNFPGSLCSGFRLPSAANSSGDISNPVALSRLAPPPLLLQSKLAHTAVAGAASFYLSNSSPTPSQTEADSGNGSTTIVPSLEMPLLELVEDSCALLKAMQELPPGATLSPLNATKDDADTNSLLMVGEDEEETVDPPTQPRLAHVYANLKAFAELLDSAPRDPEVSTEDEDEEGEKGKGRVDSGLPISKAPSTSPPTSFGMASASSWPIPEEEEEMKTLEAEETLVSPGSRARDLNWRLSRRNFSNHLARLSKLRDHAVQMKVIITEMAEEILIDCQLKRPEKHQRQALKAQNHRIVAITTAYKDLQAIFNRIFELKCELAEAISMLQEQLQTFSSELTTNNRECLRCYKNLTSISKCSAVLDQLQDTPELYVKCLLEIVRRHRMTTIWSDINDRYTARLAAFQRTESRRRETLAQALKNHILAQIFRPLHSHFRTRQHSRISLISTTAFSSNKRLTTGSKCHSTSQLNFNSPSSAFRLPANRPAEVRLRPLPSEFTDRSALGLEAALPTVSAVEMRNLASQLPADLAEMISEALLQLEADEKEVMAGFLPNLHQGQEEGEDVEMLNHSHLPGPQLRRRSRLASSPGALALLPCHLQQSADVSTSTADRLACIEETFTNVSTEDKAVAAAMDDEFARGNVCDSYRPPSPPYESSDVYLSMDASQFTEKAPSVISSTPQHLSSAFYSLHGSSGSAAGKDSGSVTSSDSVITPSNSRMSELLGGHSDCLQRLVGQINDHLPSPLTITLPTFTTGEEVESYLSEAVTCLNQLVSHFEALKSRLASASGGATHESIGVQTLPTTHDVTTECRPRDLALLMTSPTLSSTSMAISDGSVVSSTSHEPPIRIPRHECVFSNFRPDDLVLFIPMIGSDKHMQQKTTRGVPADEKTSLGDGKLSPWASQADTGVVEQWRMLSNDGHVYFLHDDDFEAFNLTRLASLPATSAPGRAPTNSPPLEILPDVTLPLSKRALPYVVGVLQSKEKCISRKDENRFSLPRNFVFFRVRARPL
ncbi:hypothetical protein TcWFU_007313 [Taenia crassiceps]|uniref:Autophagy-related protein 11 C-terminal domain-containing protein n=1 Tax=Taenia crassiceps TaxID=6207 RepID=A0ABR4Q310_9CEST